MAAALIYHSERSTMVAGMKLMKPRIDVITLAVADFDRALVFYRALGLESSGVIATLEAGPDRHRDRGAARRA
jgi:hypothetical protein